MPDSAAEHALRPALTQVLDHLGLSTAQNTVGTLLGYLDLLHRWNATYNLTSVRDPQDMLRQHLADCLAVVPPMARQLGHRGEHLRVLDVGSGGGLPGVVLAVLFPQWQVTCVDTVGKKAAFVRQVALELQLKNLCSEQARVEAMAGAPYDVVTSRAFASLADFVQLTRLRLASDGVWMALKGKLPCDEMSALSAEVAVFHVEPIAVPGLPAERCLVWMRPSSNSI
jgi:16S rRNA (guanine527-N7)-methyltransferase